MSSNAIIAAQNFALGLVLLLGALAVSACIILRKRFGATNGPGYLPMMSVSVILLGASMEAFWWWAYRSMRIVDVEFASAMLSWAPVVLGVGHLLQAVAALAMLVPVMQIIVGRAWPAMIGAIVTASIAMGVTISSFLHDPIQMALR